MTGEATADTATETTTATVETTTTDPSIEALQAEVEKWKTQSRKHEDRAKANAGAAKELEEAKRQGMTELEAAVDKARSDALAELRAEFGTKLVGAEVRAAAMGRVADVDALLEGVDGSKFLGDDGEPDRAAIDAWVDRIAPAKSENESETSDGFFDLGQGVRTDDSTALNGDPLLKGIQARLGIK